MYESKDGFLVVDVVKDVHTAILRPSDCSVFVAHPSEAKTQELAKAIANAATYKHVSLFLNRGKKNEYLRVMYAMSQVESLKFSDQVVLTYQNTNNKGAGITQMAEAAWLFYKGNPPTYSETRWFRDGFANASNHWDLSAYHDDPKKPAVEKPTVFGQFSWDLGLLLLTASYPLEFRSLTWGLNPNDQGLHLFASTFKVKIYGFAPSHEEAKMAVDAYELTTGGAK